MGEVIDFPVVDIACKKQENKLSEDPETDPYFLFICNVLNAADSCGFKLPFSLDSAARHVYERTRHTSQLAKLLDKQEN